MTDKLTAEQILVALKAVWATGTQLEWISPKHLIKWLRWNVKLGIACAKKAILMNLTPSVVISSEICLVRAVLFANIKTH